MELRDIPMPAKNRWSAKVKRKLWPDLPSWIALYAERGALGKVGRGGCHVKTKKRDEMIGFCPGGGGGFP